MARKKQQFDFAKVAMKTVGLAAGGIGGGILVDKLPDMIPHKFKALVPIAGGAVLGELAKDNDLVVAAADGLVAVGGYKAAQQFLPNVVSGTEDDYVAGPTTITDIPISEDTIVSIEDTDYPEEEEGVSGNNEDYTA